VAKASAPGKIIMFGEHFVVYGLPAIAAAIEERTVAEVSKATAFSLQDDRPETPGYKVEKRGQQEESIKLMFKSMKLDLSEARIVLGGDLVLASGVGASGASCAAIAAAANEEFHLGYGRLRINEIAYEGEKGYHGTPSGIDNSCSTYGGFIRFRRDLASGRSDIIPLDPKVTFSIVVGNSGRTSNTTAVVDDVRRQKDMEPQRFKRVFDDYRAISEQAKAALDRKDLLSIGSLMNRNHALLREIGVSCKELDEMVDAAMKAGALGAKLTGTGRGGLMIALVTADTEAQVAKAIGNAGYGSKVTKIGADGVKVIK
jgi:mevalonate kinase